MSTLTADKGIQREIHVHPDPEKRTSDQDHDLKIDHHEHHDHHDIAIMNKDYEGKPTDEELQTLRRVAGNVPLVAYLLCAVEFCERASYYGRFPFNRIAFCFYATLILNID